MFKIIPDTEKYEDVENVGRIAYCYLHGKLQDVVGYDCFGFQNSGLEKSEAGYIKSSSLEDGVYECEFENKLCTFFYWKNHNDTEAYNYAKDCYEKKVSSL